MREDVAARERRGSSQRRHCWVRNVPRCPGVWPGLLLDWRRSPAGGWEGLVVVAVDDKERVLALELWVDAADLRPAPSGPKGG